MNNFLMALTVIQHLITYRQTCFLEPMLTKNYHVSYNEAHKTYHNEFDIDDICQYLKEEHQSHVDNIRFLLEELKTQDLSHTKSITIYTQTIDQEKLWLKLNRIENESNNPQRKTLDIYVHYNPKIVELMRKHKGYLKFFNKETGILILSTTFGALISYFFYRYLFS